MELGQETGEPCTFVLCWQMDSRSLYQIGRMACRHAFVSAVIGPVRFSTSFSLLTGFCVYVHSRIRLSRPRDSKAP